MGGSTTLPESGALQQVPLESVLRSLAEQRVSGRLVVRVGGDEGVVELEEGRVAAVQFRGTQGDEALIRLIALTEGEYEVLRHAPIGAAPVGDERLGNLIVEAQKRRARLEALGRAVGGPQRVLQVDVRRLAPQLEQIPDEVNPVLNLCDGHRSVAEVLRQSAFDEVTTLRILERLLLLGVLGNASAPAPAAVDAPASAAPDSEQPAPAEDRPAASAEVVLLTEAVTAGKASADAATLPAGRRTHSPPTGLPELDELRLHPAAAGGRPSVELWPADSGASPVVARWTDYPPPVQAVDDANGFGTPGEPPGSLAAALGDQRAGADQGFSGWLDAEEARFFERAASGPLDYETAASPRRARDLFPVVLAATLGVLIAVALALILWDSPEAPAATGQVALGEATVREPAPVRRPAQPVIIPADDEAKVQSPYEAVVESARGAAPARVNTVLSADAPVVTVLRDVEALGAPTAAPAAAGSPTAAHLVAETTRGDGDEAPGEDRAPTATAPAGEPAEARPATPAEPAKAPPADAGKTFAELYAEGTRLLKRERYSQALAKFEAALIRDPGDARVYLSIGQIYFEFGNIPKALRHYRKAEALAPREPRVHLLMGLALHEVGKLGEARQHYQRYLDLAPEGSDAPAVRGLLATLPR